MSCHWRALCWPWRRWPPASWRRSATRTCPRPPRRTSRTCRARLLGQPITVVAETPRVKPYMHAFARRPWACQGVACTQARAHKQTAPRNKGRIQASSCSRPCPSRCYTMDTPGLRSQSEPSARGAPGVGVRVGDGLCNFVRQDGRDPVQRARAIGPHRLHLARGRAAQRAAHKAVPAPARSYA